MWNRKTTAKLMSCIVKEHGTKHSRDLLKEFRESGYVRDGSLTYEHRGRGNRAERRQGKVWRPFRCHCNPDWSPCPHEHLIGTGSYVTMEDEL